MADDDLIINETITIPRGELSYRASRAGGAGGQHVNTSSTRIELLWNAEQTAALADEAKARVCAKLSTRIDSAGWVRVVSSARRSQGQNREAADEKLAELIRGALVVAKKRKPTKPTRAAKEKRLDTKRKRSDTKRQRGDTSFD